MKKFMLEVIIQLKIWWYFRRSKPCKLCGVRTLKSQLYQHPIAFFGSDRAWCGPCWRAHKQKEWELRNQAALEEEVRKQLRILRARQIAEDIVREEKGPYRDSEKE